MKIAAAAPAVAVLPAELLAHCDLTDELTKAALTYAHVIIYDPYAKAPACLMKGFHKSTISEYTWQGRCRIPFQVEYSNLATIPRHLCEACYEIGWRLEAPRRTGGRREWVLRWNDASSPRRLLWDS
jgi:hypothetical protein